MTLRNSIFSLLLLLTISMSVWSIIRAEDNQAPNSQTDSLQADASMEEVSAIIYNKLGKPSLKVISPKMVHYPNDVTKITTPKITILREPTTIWNIDANYAEAIGGLDKIIFHDNVIVHHQDDPTRPITILYTSSLTVSPDKQTAETQEAVSIHQPTAKIEAIGMLADMNDGTIKFLSQAREEYAPS